MASVPLEITNFFLAMQAGRAGADDLAARFAPDAVYEEPFTGEMRRHEGREAVMAAMALGWEMPLEDMRISVDSVATDGEDVQVAWTCRSPSLPGGQGSGRNRFTFADGKIVRLITTLDEGTEPLE